MSTEVAEDVTETVETNKAPAAEFRFAPPTAPPSVATPVPPAIPPTATVGDSGVQVVRKTGLQKIRGRVKTVTLPLYDIKIDGQLVGYVGLKPNAPVTLIRQVTGDERPAIQAAVAAQKSEIAADVIVKTVPSGTL
jgi:hypothetical protein